MDSSDDMDSSEQRVDYGKKFDVETFNNFNKLTRNCGETTTQLLCRAFTLCLKGYSSEKVDFRSKGIVLVKNCFPENEVPSEISINAALENLWEIQKNKQIEHRFIRNETSRHRAIYRLNLNPSNRELECIFGPMQDTIVTTIKNSLVLLNTSNFCRKNKLDYHIRFITGTKLPSQELISSVKVSKDKASTKQGCHLDFPSPTASKMSCFLSASDETKLEVLYVPTDLNPQDIKYLSIEYNRTDFLIVRGDWPHRGTNYIR